jgi:hypothetical protein
MTSIQTLKKYFKSPGKCTDSVDTLKFQFNSVNTVSAPLSAFKKNTEARSITQDPILEQELEYEEENIWCLQKCSLKA